MKGREGKKNIPEMYVIAELVPYIKTLFPRGDNLGTRLFCCCGGEEDPEPCAPAASERSLQGLGACWDRTEREQTPGGETGRFLPAGGHTPVAGFVCLHFVTANCAAEAHPGDAAPRRRERTGGARPGTPLAAGGSSPAAEGGCPPEGWPARGEGCRPEG